MIPDLTGLLRPDGRPGSRNGRQSVARRTFDVDQRCRRQPPPALEQLRGAPQQVLGEGGIEEHNIERLRWRPAPEELSRIASLDARALRTPFAESRNKLARGRGVRPY